MDHEIENIDHQIIREGYRVDGDNGIKKIVGLNKRKSIDYFYIQKNEAGEECFFVEFSDLARGVEDCSELYDVALGESSVSSEFSEFSKKKLKKMLKNSIPDEFVSKFNGSCSIFYKISDFFSDVPSVFTVNNAKTFCIVYAPINESLSDGEKSRIIRVLANLKCQISDRLDNDLCDEVELCLLSDFS